MPSKTRAPTSTTAGGKAEDIYPLSPMQEGMLYESLYAPQSGVYVTQILSVLEGDLDLTLLERCWHSIVARHPALRTFFVWGDLRKWAQVVERQVDLPFERVDLSDMDAESQGKRIEEWRGEDRRKGFDLGKAPLMRLAVLRQREDLHVLLWTFHHLLLDGWSVSIVLGEVFALYTAGLSGLEPSLPSRLPYRDYLVWLQRQDRRAAEKFWREELAGFYAPTRLPFELAYARRGKGAGQQSSAHLLLGERVTTDLGAAARRHRVTLNTVFQGLWGYLLSRYSAERDVVFGTGVSGRPAQLEGADGMVGLFVNTVPVRVRCDPWAKLASWLRALQAGQLEARVFDYVPLVDVHGWSQVAAGEPLFEVGLNYESYPSALIDAADEEEVEGALRLRRVSGYDQTDIPWTLGVRPGRRLSLRIDYLSERFDAASAERALGHLETILRAYVAGAKRPGELPLLRPAEVRQVLEEWQPDASRPDGAVFVHRDFEAAVERFADRLAAVSGSRFLSYGELETRANKLARGLRELGVGPEVPVGIYLERNRPEALVSLLAILKAGGSYVALDPSYPRPRLEGMIAAVGLSLVLSRGELAEVIPEVARVIFLDRDWERFASLDSSALAEDPPDRAQVYLVFTSGTSGAPKGVVAEHESLGLRIASLREMYGFGPGDRLLQFCSLAFDASIEEIFPVLTSGSTLVQYPSAAELTPANLLAEVERLAVDSLHLPPAYWHELVDHLEEVDAPVPRRVRRFITGGEAPSPQKTATWARRAGNPGRRAVRMWNGYGPTEATFGCSTHEPRLAWEELVKLQRLPIGRPWPHNRLYVRDEDLLLLPVGVPGEISCGSTILTRGYLNQPGATAARFVPDPEAPYPGARMYLTGDLGRFLEDGCLDFLGRTDGQLKIRGVRIEPEEVEAALCAHPRVVAAAVAQHGEGDRRLLVGYVVARPGASPSDESLREHLLSRLPAAMVPEAFVRLSELPISPNGKIDRQVLPAPGPSAGRRRVEPETESERALLEVWRRVLGRDDMGVTDDFFELGGQSLLAVRLMAQLEKRFERRLPLAALLEQRTVRRLAALLDDPEAELPWEPLVPLAEGGGAAPLFCIHPVGGEAMCFLPLARRLGDRRPVYGLQAPRLNEMDDSPSIEALARGYLSEVKKVCPSGPYYLLGWSFGVFVAYEMGRLLQASGEEVGALFLLDTWAPLFEAPPHDEDLQMLVDLARDRAHQAGLPVPELPLKELSQLGMEARLERYLSLLVEHELIPEGVSVSQARAILHGYRARRRVVEAYRPGPYEGEITLLVASEPEDAEYLEQLERVGLDTSDRTLGWSRLTPLPVEVIKISGHHETLCAEPHVARLAVKLESLMERRSMATATVATEPVFRS